MIARIFAVVLLIAAATAAGIEAVRLIDAGAYEPLGAAEAWATIDRASLDGARAAVRRHLSPWTWESLIAPVLALPVWVVLGVPGLVLLWAAQPRGRFTRRRP